MTTTTPPRRHTTSLHAALFALVTALVGLGAESLLAGLVAAAVVAALAVLAAGVRERHRAS
jgi:hypothetical protein